MIMTNKKHERSRNCPDCGWKFPISKVSAPIDRVDGKTFNCPNCKAALVYRTSTGQMYRIFTLMTLPAIILAFIYRNSPLFEAVGTFVVLPLAIIAAVVWRRSEYIERIK